MHDNKVLEWNLTQFRLDVRDAYPKANCFGFTEVTGEIDNCGHAAHLALDHIIKEFLLRRREEEEMD